MINYFRKQKLLGSFIFRTGGSCFVEEALRGNAIGSYLSRYGYIIKGNIDNVYNHPGNFASGQIKSDLRIVNVNSGMEFFGDFTKAKSVMLVYGTMFRDFFVNIKQQNTFYNNSILVYCYFVLILNIIIRLFLFYTITALNRQDDIEVQKSLLKNTTYLLSELKQSLKYVKNKEKIVMQLILVSLIIIGAQERALSVEATSPIIKVIGL
jgi:hypothetical protein